MPYRNTLRQLHKKYLGFPVVEFLTQKQAQSHFAGNSLCWREAGPLLIWDRAARVGNWPNLSEHVKRNPPRLAADELLLCCALRREQHIDVLDDERGLVLSIQGSGNEPDPLSAKGAPVDMDDTELRVNGGSDRPFFTIKPDRPNGSLVISHHQLSPTSESKSP